MRPPATSRGAHSTKARAQVNAARRGREIESRQPAAPEPRPGEIKITRNSKRPEIKASRGPGTAERKRKPAKRPAPRRTVSDAERRVAETRRQSISSLGANHAKPQSGGRPARVSSGGGSVRAVAVGTAGGAAAATARVVQEVAKPVGAAARPMLRVVTGGLEKIPAATSSASPLMRGRALIAIAGLLAAGLIYINVGKLEYGDGYGRYTQRSTELQRENTILRAAIARRSTPERIQRYAQKMGMISPVPEQFEFLKQRRGDAVKAAKGYTAPTPVAPTPTATPPAATPTSPPVAPGATTTPTPAPTAPTTPGL